MVRVQSLENFWGSPPKTSKTKPPSPPPRILLEKPLSDTAWFLRTSLGRYYFKNKMHSEKRGRTCVVVVVGEFSLEDRNELGTWATVSTSPRFFSHRLQIKHFGCTDSFSSLHQAGRKLALMAENDFEFLILLPPPPVPGRQGCTIMPGFMGCWGIKPRAWRVVGKTRTTQSQPQPVGPFSSQRQGFGTGAVRLLRFQVAQAPHWVSFMCATVLLLLPTSLWQE